MPAAEPLCHLMEINLDHLTKEEGILLEAELFSVICKEWKEIFREQHRNYFYLMNWTIEKEETMLEANFLRLVIKDILSTEEYTLSGVAHYTDTHEDVLCDIIDGRNTNPSATLLWRIIDLHRSVRRDIYKMIMKKIAIKL